MATPAVDSLIEDVVDLEAKKVARLCCVVACCAWTVGCGRGHDAGVRDSDGAGGARVDAAVGDGGKARPSAPRVWSAWPLANYDPAGTRRSPNLGPRTPTLRFGIDLVTSMLVIGGDGTLYTTVWNGATSADSVAALDPATGATRWSFHPTPSVPTTVPPISPAIAVGPEGNVYAAFTQGPFFALRPDGSVRWQFTTGRTGPSGDLSAFSQPLVDADGRVYVGERSVVYAFESDGRLAWKYDARSVEPASPAAMADDGTIYVKEDFGDLHALDRAGAARWTLSVSASLPQLGGPVVRDDGSLLFAILGDKSYGVVDSGGGIVWQKPGAFATPFALGADGTAYGGEALGALKMGSDGTISWRAAGGGSSALVDAAGTVYSSAPGYVQAVDTTGVSTWLLTTSPAIATPSLYAIGGDGTLYARAGGRLLAIGGGGPCEGPPLDCDDGDPCTVDRCDVASAGCVHVPKCASRSACTIARCAADGACTFAAVTDGLACDDGVACSQGDACRAGQCASSASTCALGGGWPTSGYDSGRTHASTLLGPRAAALVWPAPGPRVTSFAIADDGTIYAATASDVHTVSPAGAEAPFASVAASDLELRQDGVIYAIVGGGLQAIDGGGAAQWMFSPALYAPAIGPSGAIYAASAFALNALGADGSTLWAVPTGGLTSDASPVVGPEGTVYALCTDLWAITSDGRVKWKRSVGWGTGLLVGPTGVVYVLLDGGVRAVDASGADVWAWSLGRSARFAAALSPDGGELILTAGTTLYRLDAKTGAQRSAFTPPSPSSPHLELSPPIVGFDGVIYVVANTTDDSFNPMTQATVVAVDRADHALWSISFPRARDASGGNLEIAPERRLVLTVGGALQAIGEPPAN
jgi:outer membrane protein assembly factor BamB